MFIYKMSNVANSLLLLMYKSSNRASTIIMSITMRALWLVLLGIFMPFVNNACRLVPLQMHVAFYACYLLGCQTIIIFY